MPETIKFLQENIGENLLDTSLKNIFFLDRTPKAQTTKATINWVALNNRNLFLIMEAGTPRSGCQLVRIW